MYNLSDLWYQSEAPKFELKRSKSLIHEFSINNYSGLAINPYQGCQHRCGYCYATYQWSPDFYNKIYAKSNAAEILHKQLINWKTDVIGPVMIGSATDAYQPAELRFNLTRKCINVLQEHNVPYYIFTKSTLIERDFDLHYRYKHNCFIVWSMTTCNEKIRRIVEPGTAPAHRIFTIIQKFAQSGICCGVNVDPLIPFVTDGDDIVDTILESCKVTGVRYVCGGLLRLRSDIWERMKIILNLLGIPDGINKYRRLYHFTESPYSTYVSPDKIFAERILNNLEQKIKRHGMVYGFPNHLRQKSINKYSDEQTTLLNYVK
jgi:DNA repair photolyase